MVLKSLRHFNLQQLVLSYDIACQYHINFATRHKDYSEALKINLDKIKMKAVVPKFHLPGHGDKCQTVFSFNCLEHMGRTDGENIERGWANFNALSPPTKEMGPGSRHDALDANFGAWNFKRVVGLGQCFCNPKQNVVI